MKVNIESGQELILSQMILKNIDPSVDVQCALPGRMDSAFLIAVFPISTPGQGQVCFWYFFLPLVSFFNAFLSGLNILKCPIDKNTL